MKEIQIQNQKQISKKTFAISKRQQVKNEIQASNKIRNLEGDEEIKQALRYVFTLIGLKADQIPGDIEKAVLINYIKENMKAYTAAEIRIAFELAIKGDFTTELNHYGSFSALYLSRIFNDYVEHRRQIAAELRREEDEKARKQEEEYQNRPEVKEAHAKSFDQNVIIPLFEEYQEKKSFDLGLLPPSIIYKALKERHGLFDLDKKKQEKIMNEARTRTDSEIEHRLHRFGSKEDNDFRKLMKNAITREEKRESIFQRNCHLIAVQDLFQKIIDENDHLKNRMK